MFNLTKRDLAAMAVVIPGFVFALWMSPEAASPETMTQMNVLGSDFTTQVTVVIGGIFMLLGLGRAIVDNVID